MNTEKLEQISALVDDELEHGSRFVLHGLVTEQSYKGAWGRYHLIGECLRGHMPSFVDTQLAGRISKALLREPAIQTVLRPPGLLKPVAGFAIAATVAAIAILGVRHIGSGPAGAAAPPVAFHAPAANVDYKAVAVAPVPALPVSDADYSAPDDAETRLNRYLVNYNEYRSHSGVQGTMPYARTLVHEIKE